MSIELNAYKANALCRWTLDEAVTLVREIEPWFKQQGFHVGLTGGVLYNGLSFKDVDLIVYPHKSTSTSYVEIVDKIAAIYNSAGLTLVSSMDHKTYGDEKIVHLCAYNNHRVDVFIMK